MFKCTLVCWKCPPDVKENPPWLQIEGWKTQAACPAVIVPDRKERLPTLELLYCQLHCKGLLNCPQTLHVASSCQPERKKKKKTATGTFVDKMTPEEDYRTQTTSCNATVFLDLSSGQGSLQHWAKGTTAPLESSEWVSEHLNMNGWWCG